ncbi:low affinity potassium transporter [Pleurotus pulmonarius]|nr:low affinity potassium transporter [Pleurotus pulmonarius]
MARLKLWASVRGHLNFYRIHVLTFTLLPLFFSGIFYASNGRQHVDYVDALFMCVSAFTNCGLETVELSYLTPWQQVLIFVQMCMGSPVVVSWLIVLVRRYHFAKTFQTAIAASATDDLLRPRDSRTFVHHDHLDAVPELSREVTEESRASTGYHARPEIEGENEKIGIHQTNLDHPVSILQKPGITPHHSSSKDAKEETPPLDGSLSRKGGRPEIQPYQPPPSYLRFNPVIGRNSTFYLQSEEQLIELGGVEYRALNALLILVPCYHIGLQLIAFIILAPYISTHKWSSNFVPPQVHRRIPPPWFALFQSISSYTNNGMSLVDQSMVPFQRAYVMVMVMAFLILAGNTCFPIFLRFLMFTDWFFFVILDIDNPDLATIPIGLKCFIGILQAVSIRTAGVATVAMSSIAPAVKVLYVVMMYISVYPIALSIRSTNVYEEQSLGIYAEIHDEDRFVPSGSRARVWGNYIALHARRQLAFDIWWIALAIFLVTIIERPSLDKIENYGWFNNFSIIFELVSAYGVVGLSLGTPTENYALSGAFRPLSKLIVCLVMIRGRHRGLPVAIDQAVLLPEETMPLGTQPDESEGRS